MAQVLMGKLLPNLKISLDDTNAEENIEEGEISDESDNENIESSKKEKKSVEIVRSWMKTLHNPKVYENKNGAFVTGLDLSSKVVLRKLEERAARFGLEKDEEHQITQDEINALYDSMGINIENRNANKSKNFRLDSIHMRGVNEMNTNEIFHYFNEYGPSSVEWINDFSCNVIWLDETSAARALLGMSRSLIVKRKKDEPEDSVDKDDSIEDIKEEKNNDAVILMSDSEESETDEEESVKDKNEKDVAMVVDEQKEEIDEADAPKEPPPIDVPVPPGFWRLGMPHQKAKAILLRFATKDDRKLPGAEKRSQFYQKYGNPNYGGLKGLISTSRKRKIQAARNREVVGTLTQESNTTISEIESKVNTDELNRRPVAQRSSRLKLPRMRMYADDEEDKKMREKNQPQESLSKSRSIFSRLGNKYTKEDLYHLGQKLTNSDEEENATKKVTRKVSSRYGIWNDLAKSMAEEENPTPHKNLKNKEAPRDLRSSISTSFSRRTNSLSSHHHEDFRNGRFAQNFQNRSRESSSSYKRTNIPPTEFKGDLRSKIKRMKEVPISKHRSPLCKEDEMSSDSSSE